MRDSYKALILLSILFKSNLKENEGHRMQVINTNVHVGIPGRTPDAKMKNLVVNYLRWTFGWSALNFHWTVLACKCFLFLSSNQNNIEQSFLYFCLDFESEIARDFNWCTVALESFFLHYTARNWCSSRLNSSKFGSVSKKYLFH